MNDQKKQIRPIIPSAQVNAAQSDEENFQNAVLRPIIKLQHQLLIIHFEQHLNDRKIEWFEKDINQKREILHKLMQKDIQLKITLRTMVTALFTIPEYIEYTKKTNEYNKRIKQMIHQKLQKNYIM